MTNQQTEDQPGTNHPRGKQDGRGAPTSQPPGQGREPEAGSHAHNSAHSHYGNHTHSHSHSDNGHQHPAIEAGAREDHEHEHAHGDQDHPRPHTANGGHNHPHPHGEDGHHASLVVGIEHTEPHSDDHPHGNQPEDHHQAPGGGHDHGHGSGGEHDHEHPHDNHGHHHEHGDHDHQPPGGLWGQIRHLFSPHSHGHQEAALDAALATERGIWAVKVSLVVLLATAAFQVVIIAISGSVALLADTIHNFSDALTAVPLGLAFTLARRARDRRFTYGYGRAEDIAGVIIVLMILFSAGQAIYQAVLKIIDPSPLSNLGWVAVAAVVGFFGNEAVAVFRIRVGKEIGSAALVADGYHARTDGFTSLAVLAGVIGAWLGYPILDPIVGMLIGLAILVIVWNSARDIAYRVMDGVDPQVTHLVEITAGQVKDVLSVHDTAIRWVGHRQRAELHITVDCQLPTYASHHIAEEVRHALFHRLPALVDVTVHVDPCECAFLTNHHHHTEHHAKTSSK